MGTVANNGVYKIVRTIGSNFVCSLDQNGQEIILRGLGIGFKKTAGDLIPAARVEKVYALRDPSQSDRLLELMQNISTEYLDISTHLIETAERVLGKTLSENVYITLTDHISYAVERFKKGIHYPNELIWEIRTFYQQEYELGKQALDVIESVLGLRLNDDEAGFIALHIVNAELDGKMSDMIPITQIISCAIDTAQNYYNVVFNNNSLDYDRFIVHMKFLSQRLIRKQYISDNDSNFHNMIAKHYKNDFDCAKKIGAQIEKEFNLVFPKSEQIFLTVHLHRLSISMGLEQEEE